MIFFGVTFASFDDITKLVCIGIAFIFLGILYIGRVKSVTRTLAHTTRLPLLFTYYSPLKTALKIVLACIGCCMLLIALARPQYGKKEHTVQQQGRDLFIALDISRSMLAQDYTPNRLTCAKNQIKELIQALGCERVGLIVFSGSTFVQCPLTSDYGAFLMYLDSIDVETISSGTTCLDQPIAKALQAFKQQKDRKNKLLVIFTDGEDFSGNLAHVREQATQEKMTIFTVGVGTSQGAPIPIFNEQGVLTGHQLDPQGSVVISRLNEPLLRALAQECGGQYIASTKNSSDIATLARIVDSFEKYALGDITFNQYEERYNYAACISFIAFLLEWLL